MNIEITDAEKELLESILSSYLSDLKEEIHHSETADFKVALKDRKEIVTSLLNKIK